MWEASMVPVTKKLLTISALAALALISAFAGGTVGFVQGYSYGLGETATRASTLTTALRALRRGDVANGLSHLESDLDTLVMEHWASNRKDPPFTSWLLRTMRDDTAENKLFAQVARYRVEYPSSERAPAVKETIAAHLKGFQAQ
jgi:hypothetical protein